jgi:hypothetical protein
VSTFPFLAVLLGAMGALILLLLVMDRRSKIVARNRAIEAHTAQLALRAKEENRLLQDEESRRAEWESKRRELHELLRRQEDELDQERRSLDTKLAALSKDVVKEKEDLKNLAKSLLDERARLDVKSQLLTQMRDGVARSGKLDAASQLEVDKLARDLADLERALHEAKTLKTQEQETYSLVPYRGKLGEGRPPVYVECRADALVFHPDEQRLTKADFDIRVFRNEVERRGVELVREKRDPDRPKRPPVPKASNNPYVLFLVRPDGLESYYSATTALRGFDLDYGYEFIDAHWVLDFQHGPTFAGQRPANQDALLRSPGTPVPPRSGYAGQAPPLFTAGQTSGPGLGPLASADGPAGSASGPIGFGPPGSDRAKSGGFSPLPSPSAGDRRSPGAGNGTAASHVGGGYEIAGEPRLGSEMKESRGSSSPAYPPSAGSSGSAGSASVTSAAGVGGGYGIAGEPRLGPLAPDTGLPVASSGNSRSGMGGSSSGVSFHGSGSAGAQASGANEGSGNAASSNTGNSVGGSPTALGSPASRTGQGTSIQNPSTPGQLAQAQPPQNKGDSEDVAWRGSSAPSSRNGQGAATPQGTEGAAPGRGGGGGNGNNGGDPGTADPLARLAPTLPFADARPGPKKAMPAPTVGRLLANRDYMLTIECFGSEVALYPGSRVFAMTDEVRQRNVDETLVQAVLQLIARRQATVRTGETPYRPMLRFQVHPEALRTYFHVYPLFENLRIPMTRENLDS